MTVWLAMVFTGIFFAGGLGKEFSPYSFNLREFETRRSLGRTVVHPAALACSKEISKYLANATVTSGIERWDLVDYSNGIWGTEDFEASIIADCFKLVDSHGDNFWEGWSKDHPELAKILWPAVQQLAIHRSYFALPELFQVAAKNPTPGDLQSRIAKICLQAGLDQGLRQLHRKEFGDARITLEWTKKFGGSPELDALENSIRAESTATTASKR